MIALQYKTFKYQTIFSVVFYIPALFVMIFIVNFKLGWSYDSNVIMSNTTFNFASAMIIYIGVVSLFLSFEPNWVVMMKKMANYFADLNKELAAAADQPDGMKGNETEDEEKNR